MSGAFDLDRFAPAPTKFKLKGKEYRVSGDPDVDVVARMLRIEDTIRRAGENPDPHDGTHETVTATVEGRDLLLEMVQEQDPSVTGIKVGTVELLTIFALIIHGPSVAAAVMFAIANPNTGGTGAGERVTTPHEGDDEPDVALVDEEDAESLPLASALPSPEPLSVLVEADAGLLAIGSD